MSLSLQSISERLTCAGVEHLATLQHLMTNHPIVVWECDLRTGVVSLQHSNPSPEESPDVARVIAIGEGRIS